MAEIKSTSVEVSCEWQECDEVFPDIAKLNEHIFEHLNSYLNDTVKQKEHACSWGDCEFRTSCHLHFQRHSYFHGYYTYMLTCGKHELNSSAETVGTCKNPPMKFFSIPDLQNDFLCQWNACDQSFLSIVDYQDHVAKHAMHDFQSSKPICKGPASLICKWIACQKPIQYVVRLNEHICKHAQLKELACSHCGQLMRSKSKYHDHILRQQSTNSGKYQCGQCLKYFSAEKFLKKHVMSHVNSYKCTICDMTHNSFGRLALHIRYRHMSDRPHKCPQCDSTWVRNADLKKHIHMVHENEFYVCHHPKCRYAGKSATLLRKHLSEKHEHKVMLYVCHCCEESFKTGTLLSAHLMSVHNFQLPPGHKRFIYRKDDERGFYCLETRRIEVSDASQRIGIAASTKVDSEKLQITTRKCKANSGVIQLQVSLK